MSVNHGWKIGTLVGFSFLFLMSFKSDQQRSNELYAEINEESRDSCVDCL